MSKFSDVLKKAGIIEDDETANELDEEATKEIIEKDTNELDKKESNILFEDPQKDTFSDNTTKVSFMKNPVKSDGSINSEVINGTVEGLLTIEDIYLNNGLSDLDHSILKVDEFIKALPETLPTDVKKQTLLGILKATKLEVPNLLEDANKRITTIEEALKAFSQETDNIISKSNTELEDLQKKMDGLKQKVNDRKKIQENQTTLVNQEIERINLITKILE